MIQGSVLLVILVCACRLFFFGTSFSRASPRTMQGVGISSATEPDDAPGKSSARASIPAAGSPEAVPSAAGHLRGSMCKLSYEGMRCLWPSFYA